MVGACRAETVVSLDASWTIGVFCVNITRRSSKTETLGMMSRPARNKGQNCGFLRLCAVLPGSVAARAAHDRGARVAVERRALDVADSPLLRTELIARGDGVVALERR